MAAPVMTFGATGNADASATLALNTSRTFNLDLSTKLEGQVLVEGTFHASATQGCRIRVFPGYGSTPTYSTTNPNYEYSMPYVSGAQKSPKIYLSTGKYQIQLTNLDTGQSITVLQATLDTVDSIT